MDARVMKSEFEQPSMRCWDTEDVEGWLVDEGIGYVDSGGTFHYGPKPMDEDDFANLDIPDGLAVDDE
jgi:hypothetical protein